MANETVSEDIFEAERCKWVKWVTPIVLLLLVLVLVTAMALSDKLQATLDNSNNVISVLTAILCTLLAVSLILTGCVEWFKKIEQNVWSLGTDVTMTRVELHRISKANLHSSEESGTEISWLEKNQRLMQEKVEELKNVIEKEYNVLRQAVQDNKQGLANEVTVVAQAQKEVQTGISELQQANELISERVTTITDGLERLDKTLQTENGPVNNQLSELAVNFRGLDKNIDNLYELTEKVSDTITNVSEGQATLQETTTIKHEELTNHLQALSEDQQDIRGDVNSLGEKTNCFGEEIANLAAEQAALREALHINSEGIEAGISTLKAGWEQLENNIDTIQVLTQTAASSITNIADEQAALHKTLRENSQVLTDSTHVVEKYHQALQSEVNKLAETGQQATDSFIAMTNEQAALRETIEIKSEEAVSKLITLSESQQGLQTEMKDLSEKADHVAAEVTNLTTQQSTISEVLKVQHEARDTQISALSAEVTNLTAQQATVSDILKTHSEATDVQASALTAGQKQLETYLDGLRELMQTVDSGISNTSDKQDALHTLLEKTTQIVTDNIQVIENNQEIFRTMMSDLDQKATEMAAENVDSHKEFDNRNKELTGKMVALLESQLSFHAGVTLLAEKTSQLVRAVDRVITEQTTLNETLQTHTETINVQMSDLNIGHEQLDANVSSLQELTKTVVDGVTNVSNEQVEMHGALQDNTQALTRNTQIVEQHQKTLQAEVTRVAETSKEIAAAATAMADEQADFQETVKANNEDLTSHLSLLSENQQSLRVEVNQVAETGHHINDAVEMMANEQAAMHKTTKANNENLSNQLSVLLEKQQSLHEEVNQVAKTDQHTGAVIAAMANEQAVLHETVKSNNEDLTNQLSTLSENQQALHMEVSQVAKTGQHTEAAISTMANEQASMHQALQENTQALTGNTQIVEQHQKTLQTEVNKVAETSKEIAVAATAMATEQAAFHETVKANNEDLTNHLSALSENQQSLRVEVSQVAQTGQDTRAAIATMSTKQAALHETVKAGNENLTKQISTISENQQSLRAEVDRVAEMDHHIGSAIATIANEHNALHKTVKANDENLTNRLSTLSKNQQSLQAEVIRVAETSRHTDAAVEEITNEQAALHEMVKVNNERLTDQVSTFSENQKSVHMSIRDLEGKVTEMSTDVDSITEEQATLQQCVQNSKKDLVDRIGVAAQNMEKMQTGISELRQTGRTLSDTIASLAHAQETLKEAMHQENNKMTDQLTALTSSHGHFHSNYNSLRELIQKVADNLTHIADEQASKLREILEDQQCMQTNIGVADEKIDKVVDDIDSINTTQTVLREMIGMKSDELAGQIGALAEDQRIVQNGLNENVNHVAGEVAKVTAEQLASRETYQAHAEALSAQISDLAAIQEQLERNINTAAASLTKIAEEQAALHGTLQGNSSTLADSMRVVEQFQQTLQAEISNVAQASQQAMASIEAMAVEQTALREMIGAKSDELAGQIGALAEDQRIVQNGLNENVNHVAGEVAKVTAEQLASRETYQAHAEALSAQISGLAAAQEQLERNINTAAASLTKIAEEQAALHGTLQGNSSTLADSMRVVEQFQQILQAEISNVAQASQQAMASIEAMTVEQTALREMIGMKSDD